MHPLSSNTGGTCLPLLLELFSAWMSPGSTAGSSVCLSCASLATLLPCRQPNLGVYTWSSQGKTMPLLSSAHTNR